MNTFKSGYSQEKSLKVLNIRFFKINVEITDKTSSLVKYTETVSNTFKSQKNRWRNVSVTQPRSGKALCPVLIRGEIVQRILSYKDSSENSFINFVLIGKVIHYLKASEMCVHLGHMVDSMDAIGFTGKDIGTHSIHSSFTMALYLANQPVYKIMLIGRWCSDALLLYMRRHVQKFSAGVSVDMIQ